MEPEMLALLLTIFICCVLPITIVWIVSRRETNKVNKNAEIILKAIENNSVVDTDKLITALGKPKKTFQQHLYDRFLRGCVFAFAGGAILVVKAVMQTPGKVVSMAPTMIGAVSLAIGLAYLVTCYFMHKSIRTDSDAEQN